MALRNTPGDCAVVDSVRNIVEYDVNAFTFHTEVMADNATLVLLLLPTWIHLSFVRTSIYTYNLCILKC